MNKFDYDIMFGNTTSTNTNAGIPGAGSLNLDTVRDALKRVKELPRRDKWIIINPNGQMYEGTVSQLLRVLVEAHPLMNDVENSS